MIQPWLVVAALLFGMVFGASIVIVSQLLAERWNR